MHTKRLICPEIGNLHYDILETERERGAERDGERESGRERQYVRERQTERGA